MAGERDRERDAERTIREVEHARDVESEMDRDFTTPERAQAVEAPPSPGEPLRPPRRARAAGGGRSRPRGRRT